MPDKTTVNGLRSSLRDVTTIRSAKTVHFNVPLAETLYFHYQDNEDEESRFEDAFLDFYTKSFLQEQKEHLYILPPLPTYNRMVYLEQMDWHDTLDGTIVVDNLGYKKSVMVRVTFDDWKSCIDIDAHYKESMDGYDRFSFSISIPEHHTLLSLTCRLAIQYRVNGDCYWDNNDAKNYAIRWLL
jgi:hypothetical protein